MRPSSTGGRLPRLVVALVVVVAAPAVATSAPAATSASRAEPSGSITVSAAASLTEAFTAIGKRFERKYDGTSVRFNFGSSAALVVQIENGAPADVFASADLTNMDEVVRAGEVTESPGVFARNALEIAVKPGNPEHVEGLADLADVGTVALCNASAPCGEYAAKVLRRAEVNIPESTITRGVDAKATIAAVSLGDANAAIVYTTDVDAAGDAIEGVIIPEDENTIAVYPIARLVGSANPKLARAFVRFVRSRAGQQTLAKFGFLGA